MNADVLTQYCVYADYPIFRWNIKRFRDKFQKVILYPSRHHGVLDLEAFAKRQIKETWVEPVSIDYGVEDWRQAETIPMLKHAEAEWLLFMEQDFFVDDWQRLYDDVGRAIARGADAIGWWNQTAFPYLHPCFFLLKRELFERTRNDFRAHPEIPGADHFAMLTRDIERLGGTIITLQSMGWENWVNAFHLGGLTYVYQDFKGKDTTIGVGNVEAFMAYNYWMRQAPGEQDREFLHVSKEVESVLIEKFPDVDLGTAVRTWGRFFR